LIGPLARGLKVVHLHWGGGTPSILGAGRLCEIYAALKNSFEISARLEHAMELDPRRVTKPLVGTLADIGVNRASLGVQEFSAQVQHAIGRIQPYGVVVYAVEMLRAMGINRIAFDLMYGLPRQTPEDVQRTAALAVALGPQRVALFGYAHVPWFKPHQRLIEEAALPGPLERLKQAETARNALTAAGYEPIGLDHFARCDDELAAAARQRRLRRNFQGYTTDNADALIGLGASAISRLPQGFLQNKVDIRGYSGAVQAGRLAAEKGLALSPGDRLRGRIIEELMCHFDVDLGAMLDDVDAADALRCELADLERLAGEGIVRFGGGRITVTDEGRPFVRLVAAVFDAYLRNGSSRHSAAV
jgi:oxygen-independent coproporphyrinogen-3 oxidase